MPRWHRIRVGWGPRGRERGCGRPVICRIICQHRGESERIISDRPPSLHWIRPASFPPMTRVGGMRTMICSTATARRAGMEGERDNGMVGLTDTPHALCGFHSRLSHDNRRLRQAGAVAVPSRRPRQRRVRTLRRPRQLTVCADTHDYDSLSHGWLPSKGSLSLSLPSCICPARRIGGT